MILFPSFDFDGAWWRHEAPSVAEMMEEAWKSGRQVYRLLLAMDMWKEEWFRGGFSLGRGLEVKRVSSLKDDSQVAIVRSVLNSNVYCTKIQECLQMSEILAFIWSHLHMRKESLWMEWALILALRSSLEKEAWSWPLDNALEKEEAFLTLGCFGSMRCRKKC